MAILTPPINQSSAAPGGAQVFDNATGTWGAFKPTVAVQPTGGLTNNANPVNAGKAGYDVFGNPVSGTPLASGGAASPPPQPPKPVTAFSSDSANQTNQTNTQKLQNYGASGLGMDSNGFAINADRSFAEAPVGSVPNANGGFTDLTTGINYYLGNSAGKISSDPTTQALYDQFSSLKASMDATGAANIANIQAQFTNLIKQQEQTNTSQQASADKTLLMGGSSRYAQISSAGQSSAMVAYGVQQIADLNQKENAAVIAAQQAMQNNDYTMLNKQLSIADSARQEKQAAAQKLSDTLTTQADNLKKQQATANQDQAIASQLSNGVTDPAAIMAAINGTTNPATGQPYALTSKDVSDAISNLNPDAKAIADLMTSAAKNGATPDQLKAIGSAKSINGAIQAAGTGLIDPTSNLGQYQTYSQNAIAKGQTPLSYTKWDATNSANKAYSSAYSAKAGANAADNENASNTSSPTNTSGTSISGDVKDILEGRNSLYNIRQTMGRSNSAAAYMQNVRNQIRQQDPNFDFIASDAGGKSVSTSYVQKATAAINSVLPNIQTITDLSNQVDRVGITGVDALLQKGGIIINNQKVSNFHEAQKLIADEIGVALGAGTVSDMKLQLGFDVTDPSVSQEVFASNMGVVKSFLENRKDGLNSLRYKSSTVGTDNLNPVAKATADETAAAAAIKTYDAASPDNQKRVDDLHTKFPNASATDIKTALGI